MRIEPRTPTAKGPAERFVGDVWVDMIAVGEPPSRLRVGTVRFAPGAHTAWHRHANGQTLHVTDGVGLVQARGGEVVVMRAGDTVYTPPGEWHWHGATAENFMIHLALSDGLAEDQDGPETDWGDHLADGEYPEQVPEPVEGHEMSNNVSTEGK